MNLKNNKGYTGIDVSIAMIIILIFIPTTFGIVYSIQRVRARTEREASAVSIATDILELAKMTEYSEVELSNSDSLFKTNLNNKYSNIQISITSDNNANFSYSDNNGVHYKVQISINNYYPPGIEDSEKKDYVKQISVVVTYPVGKITKTVNISTVLEARS